MFKDALPYLITAGASIIVGILSFLGVWITNKKSNEKIQFDMDKRFEVYRAVTDEKIDELTRETREHNNFGQRIPVLENEIEHLKDELKNLEGEIKK